jgi:hypothetical protein
MSDLLGMQRAVWRSNRSTTEKIVLLAIIDHYSDSSPEPWPSVPTLAACASLGRTAVLDALASLERDGVIAVRRVAGRPNRYDLSHVQATPHQEGREELETSEPVRDADRCEELTSPFGGRDQSVWRTGPVRPADPKDPKKDPMKEPTAVRTRAGELDPAMPSDPEIEHLGHATVAARLVQEHVLWLQVAVDDAQ